MCDSEGGGVMELVRAELMGGKGRVGRGQGSESRGGVE